MSFNVGKLGIDLARTSTVQEHELGLEADDNAGNEFKYVVAGGAITAKAPVTIVTGNSATVAASGGIVDGVAPVAIASGSYGWVQTAGVVQVDAATDVDAGDFVSWIADASSRVTEVVAVAESGSTAHAAGAQGIRGRGLVNEAANVATIRLNRV